MMEQLIDFLTASVWAYPILLGIAAGDAVLPVLPSETAVIVCGIQAGRGELELEWVIVFAAMGAFIGDNASYALGRWAGNPPRSGSSAAGRRGSGWTAQGPSSRIAAAT
jgi:membrane-associated protein